ncbi:MAG: TIGR02281 family clan AA aspartic protease [Kangiellaceae bacterium]|nr:TIGR02281 family clan AA aspartic protease [Kangiellaceae bacterium]
MNEQKEHSDESVDERLSSVGKTMTIIAWIIGIGFATWFFAGIENRQHNPNYYPESSRDRNTIKVELQRNKYGHYVTNGKLDGKEVVFMLDTGATDIAIPGALEKKLNLTRGYSFQVHTANGTATAYSTDIEYIQIGEIILRNVRASISPTMLGEDILLGMSALKQIEFRQKGDRLTLIQELD